MTPYLREVYPGWVDRVLHTKASKKVVKEKWCRSRDSKPSKHSLKKADGC